jgi:oligopeptide transport system permease protein
LTDPSTNTTEAAIESPSVQILGAPAQADGDKPRGLWGDAWRDLRKMPLFWISLLFIIFIVVVACFPSLFSSRNPTIAGSDELNKSLQPPSADAWFGYDQLGRDVYARTIYGARASIIVGLASVLLASVWGGFTGILGGYFGGWIDSIISRIGDIFLGIPFVLGGIVVLSTFVGFGGASAPQIIGLVVLTIAGLTWPAYTRVMRASVISGKQADYVQAARALGASTNRILFRHLLPNCMAPIVVISTLNVGAYIGAEAALSYLGIGLRAPVVSWGVEISDATNVMRDAPHVLLFPSLFLTATILSFVVLGDALREALDPKLR